MTDNEELVRQAWEMLKHDVGCNHYDGRVYFIGKLGSPVELVRKLVDRLSSLLRERNSAIAERDTIRDRTIDECARLIELIGYDWRDSGMQQKQYAAEYLAEQLRALKQPDTADRSDEQTSWQLGGPRCDFCDNGLNSDWAFCPYCSRVIDHTKALDRSGWTRAPVPPDLPPGSEILIRRRVWERAGDGYMTNVGYIHDSDVSHYRRKGGS